jgi:hypothetical protein
MAFPTPGPPALLDSGPDALRAIVAGDGPGVDAALAGLGSGDLMELSNAAQFLVECCAIASRGRGW